MNDNNICEGCDERKENDELETVEMKYGGTERLCLNCRKQSWEMMK